MIKPDSVQNQCVGSEVRLVPDSLPKGGGEVWYSCMDSNLQSMECQRHESDWWCCGTSQVA